MRRLLRALAASAVVAGLTALVVFFGAYLLFPVTGVEVKGARMFPERAAWAALPDRASLLTFDKEAYERKIKANPWVESAKVLEDRQSGIVVVEVKERKAVMSGELNGKGAAWAADGTRLPGTGGARLKRVGLDEGRLEEVLGISRVLGENGVRLDSVDRVGAGGVGATVEGRDVVFGDKVGAGQARALVGVMKEHPEAPYFDLRSPERIVVGASGGGAPPGGTENG